MLILLTCLHVNTWPILTSATCTTSTQWVLLTCTAARHSGYYANIKCVVYAQLQGTVVTMPTQNVLSTCTAARYSRLSAKWWDIQPPTDPVPESSDVGWSCDTHVAREDPSPDSSNQTDYSEREGGERRETRNEGRS